MSSCTLIYGSHANLSKCTPMTILTIHHASTGIIASHLFHGILIKSQLALSNQSGLDSVHFAKKVNVTCHLCCGLPTCGQSIQMAPMKCHLYHRLVTCNHPIWLVSINLKRHLRCGLATCDHFQLNLDNSGFQKFQSATLRVNTFRGSVPTTHSCIRYMHNAIDISDESLGQLVNLRTLLH